jgi:hypothetical protein
MTGFEIRWNDRVFGTKQVQENEEADALQLGLVGARGGMYGVVPILLRVNERRRYYPC